MSRAVPPEPVLGAPEADISIDGPRTRSWTLAAEDCQELAARRMARIGFAEAAAPYRRVRVRPAGSFILAAKSGEGRVLLDGRWQRIAAGMICMAPPRMTNAFHAVAGHRWSFAWLRYDEPSPTVPIIGAASPVRLRTGADEFIRIAEGLRFEWDGRRDAKLIHHWLSLLDGAVRRAAQPWQTQPRTWKLWQEVSADLSAEWSLESLARKLHMSTEHLRRLCARELGRSPMQHLTYMRMQRAQELLEKTTEKLDAIAPAVGYANAMVFSRAFQRWIGCSPTDYRQSGRQEE